MDSRDNVGGVFNPDALPTNRLYQNNGDGTFTDVTQHAGIGDTGYGIGCCVADYDNDGNWDLFITNFGENILYRNDGDGTFTDVTSDARIIGEPCFSAGCAFADYDNDGWLDKMNILIRIVEQFSHSNGNTRLLAHQLEIINVLRGKWVFKEKEIIRFESFGEINRLYGWDTFMDIVEEFDRVAKICAQMIKEFDDGIHIRSRFKGRGTSLSTACAVSGIAGIATCART